MPLNPDRWDDADAKAAWLRHRCGKLTSSNMAIAMSFTQKKQPTAERKNLLKALCAERVTQQNVRHYVSPEMQWGLDQQANALAAYEAENGVLVNCDPYRFTVHPDRERFDENLGASDDGFIGQHGQVEIKCPTTSTFMEWRMAGVVPDEHKPQMIIELECSRRHWCDFVAYDPRIRNPRLQLLIIRYEPNFEEREPVLIAAEQFLKELDDLFYRFTHG